MELENKKIAFLGDSITEGSGISDVKDTFWNVIARETGAKCYGYGVGGTRIAPQRQPSAERIWDRDFLSRVGEMVPDADIVIVFGGTNDFGHGDAPFGTLTDRTDKSFCGAYHLLLQKLLQRYPMGQIVAMTPLHRDTENDLGVNEMGIRRDHTLRQYADAILEISGYYAVPVLDLFRCSGIQPAVPIIKELYMPDGLHPSERGHRRIAERLIRFLGTL